MTISSLIKNTDCILGMKNLEDNSIDLILTDPPYNLGLFMNNRQTNLKKMRENSFYAAGWDDLTNENWLKHMDCFFSEAQRVLKKGGAMLMFMSILKVESLIKLSEKYRFYKNSCTPICLLTLYIPHATMRKITYDWVRCLLT